MPYVTRISDRTTGTCNPGLDCCPHSRSGTNAEGTQLLEVDGELAHLVGHSGPCNCPHGGTFESARGSELFEVDGIPVTLIGHTTICRSCGQSGSHISGSELLEVER